MWLFQWQFTLPWEVFSPDHVSEKIAAALNAAKNKIQRKRERVWQLPNLNYCSLVCSFFMHNGSISLEYLLAKNSLPHTHTHALQNGSQGVSLSYSK
jgi:hypothetical protein